MAVCLCQFSGKKMPWWNRASFNNVNKVILMQKAESGNSNQQRTEATSHMLHVHVAKSHNGLIKMSPEMAARILADCNFEGQRSISRPRVFDHAYAIKEGDWVDDYPIHFAVLPDGRTWLVDGQHRLTAIAEQTQAVGIVVRMVDVDTEKDARHFYAGFDKRNSTRTNVQILDAVELAKEVGLSNRMARAELIERAVAGEKVSAKPAATAPAIAPTAAQTSHRHPSIAKAIRKALRGILDDFGCMAVLDLIPIIQAQDAQEEVQEIFEEWSVAVYPVGLMALVSS